MSEKTDTPIKAVLYTDGGYHAQYLSGGWGVHGYTYVNEPPTKGTGNPKCIPTDAGYALTKEPERAVTIKSYIDGVGGVNPAHSSNHTELVATIKGLEHVLEKRYAHTQIFSDSQYVVNGMNKWINKWQKMGWVNSEGAEVSNKALWLTAADLKQQLAAQKLPVQLSWIKGHAGDFGNELADSYAKRGNVLGRKNSSFTFMMETPADGYWTKKNEYNRLLSNGRWYFQTTDEEIITQDGKTIYYVGDHGKDDEQTGKRNADNAMVVLYLNEPDPVLEILRKQARDLDTRKFGSVMVGRLDTIFNPNFYTEVLAHGATFLDWTSPRKNIITHTKKPVLKEMSPAGLAYIQIDTLNSLQRTLNEYLAGDAGVLVTDITDLIYDTEQKKTGSVRKLKSSITQSTKYFDVSVKVSPAKRKELLKDPTAQVKEKPIRLIMGLDLAGRNILASIANDDVAVKVITWRESDVVIRFATVIETNHGLGIWSGIDANYLMV